MVLVVSSRHGVEDTSAFTPVANSRLHVTTPSSTARSKYPRTGRSLLLFEWACTSRHDDEEDGVLEPHYEETLVRCDTRLSIFAISRIKIHLMRWRRDLMERMYAPGGVGAYICAESFAKRARLCL